MKQPAACSCKRCTIAGLSIIGAFVVCGIIAAICIGVLFGRTNSSDPRTQIVQIFVDKVKFPNGSFAIPASDLSLNTSLSMPSIANSTVLQQLGITVDPTNNVLVVNRQTFIYIVVPKDSTAVSRGRRDVGGNVSSAGIGLQFGGSKVVHVLPFDLLARGLGFLLRGRTADGSSVYQVPISSPASMCSASSESQCAAVTYQAYSISGTSASPSSAQSSLSAACGPQCQGRKGACSQSCQICDNSQVAGADTPVSRRFHVGKSSGTFKLMYQMYTLKDRIRVFQEDKQIYDTHCVSGGNFLTIPFEGTSEEIRVDVEPNCEGTTGTIWDFQFFCPDPCESTFTDQVKLMNGPFEVKQGGTVYIDEEANMPSLTAVYCAPSASPTISWTFSIDVTGTNDAPCSGDATEVKSTGNKWNIISTYQQKAQQTGKAKVRGGKATLKWTVTGGQTGSLTFQILGTQPDRQAILDYINSRIIGNQRLWMLPYIAAHESTQVEERKVFLTGPSHFDGKNYPGYPLRSWDNGSGVFQLTLPAPTCQQIWSWKANCKEGIQRMKKYVQDANEWMNSPTIVNGRPKGQRVQARNEMGYNVPVTNHTTANCVFADNTSRIIEDAVAMKMFNSASVNYCSWDNRSKKWLFNELNLQNFNYVERICKLVKV